MELPSGYMFRYQEYHIADPSKIYREFWLSKPTLKDIPVAYSVKRIFDLAINHMLDDWYTAQVFEDVWENEGPLRKVILEFHNRVVELAMLPAPPKNAIASPHEIEHNKAEEVSEEFQNYQTDNKLEKIAWTEVPIYQTNTLDIETTTDTDNERLFEELYGELGP